jgi:light-regulated signal transduction histidine kinase (bacteriophytochrome)
MRKETIYSLKDNGVGFDDRDANKLSAVVQRLRRAEEYEGTGVGLAMVKHKIKRRNGCLWAEGKGSDGATNYFTLHKQGFMLSSR